MKKMKVRTMVILIILSVTVFTIVSFGAPLVFHFGLEYLPKDSKIVKAETNGSRFFFIDENGSCYAAGIHSQNGYSDLGVKHHLMYDYCSSFGGKILTVKIFDNAAEVQPGTIITKEGDLYAFTDLPGYYTPRYITGNVLKAVMIGQEIFYIDVQHELNRCSLKPLDFNKCGISDVQDIQWMYHTFSILHTNGELSVYENIDEFESGNEMEHYSDIAKFSVIEMELKADQVTSLLALLKTDGTLWLRGRFYQWRGLYNPKYEDIDMRKVADDVTDVGCYGKGVVYINKQKQMRIYGYDLVKDEQFLNCTLKEDIIDLATSDSSVYGVSADGKVWQWGDTLAFIEQPISFLEEPVSLTD